MQDLSFVYSLGGALTPLRGDSFHGYLRGKKCNFSSPNSDLFADTHTRALFVTAVVVVFCLAKLTNFILGLRGTIFTLAPTTATQPRGLVTFSQIRTTVAHRFVGSIALGLRFVVESVSNSTHLSATRCAMCCKVRQSVLQLRELTLQCRAHAKPYVTDSRPLRNRRPARDLRPPFARTRNKLLDVEELLLLSSLL